MCPVCSAAQQKRGATFRRDVKSGSPAGATGQASAELGSSVARRGMSFNATNAATLTAVPEGPVLGLESGGSVDRPDQPF